MFFSLEDPSGDLGEDDEGHHGYMVHGQDPKEEDEMQHDEGHTFTDDRRKPVPPRSTYSSDWEKVSSVPPMPAFERPQTFEVWQPDGPWDPQTSQGRFVEETQEIIKPTILAKVEIREVSSFQNVRPDDLENMKAYQLQALCEKWGIQTGGAKKDLLARLNDLFRGLEVPKKKCSVQFVKLVEEEPSLGHGSTAAASAFVAEPGGPLQCPQRRSPMDAATPKTHGSGYRASPPGYKTPEHTGDGLGGWQTFG